MSVRVEDGLVLFNCHHCGASGALKEHRMEKPRLVVNQGALKAPSENLLQYLAGRGISRATVEACGIKETTHYFRELGCEAPCMAFLYPNGIKFRSYPEKHFSWAGGDQTFWRINEVVSGEPIYITEGELDVASLVEAGLSNVVSVPSGAPMKVRHSLIDPSEDKKFAYIYAAKDILDVAPKIILATDTDLQGKALAEELARRLNRNRCWRPTIQGKDPNQELQDHGAIALRTAMLRAEPWPIVGLYSPDRYFPEVQRLYENGYMVGEKIGYQALDELYSVALGQLTLVTGIPGGGKTNFVDQIMVNLAKRRGWKFAICSFENPPDLHIIQLAEKYHKLSFFRCEQQPSRRMTQSQLDQAQAWVREHFMFIEQSDGAMGSIDGILERAMGAVQRIGARGLVIDPYNYIHKTGDRSETDQAALILSATRQFAVAHGAHVWFIAHPQKLQRDSEGSVYVPKGYDVSGSAHFFNMPDMGLTVHRRGSITEVHNWKTRFKWLGKLGMCRLSYDPVVSSYGEFHGDQEAEGWKAQFQDPAGGHQGKSASVI